MFGGSGAEYVRKEIPLYVLPSLSLINLDSPLSSYTDLQHVLFEEERTAYNQAILQNTRWYLINYIHSLSVHIWNFIETFFVLCRDGKAHPLTFIHHTSTYQASLCKLIEYWSEQDVHLFYLSFLLVCSLSLKNYYFLIQFKSCNKRTSRSTQGEWNSGIYIYHLF